MTDWNPVIPDGWGDFPKAAFKRSTVYKGNAQSWAYSHHQTITKFGDKYVASWSNGLVHEDYIGQEVHLAWSADGIEWSQPQVIANTPIESKLVRNNAGLYATNEHLYNYVCVATDMGRDVSPPGMCAIKNRHMHLDVYETTDLVNWTHR